MGPQNRDDGEARKQSEVAARRITNVEAAAQAKGKGKAPISSYPVVGDKSPLDSLRPRNDPKVPGLVAPLKEYRLKDDHLVCYSKHKGCLHVMGKLKILN